MRTLVVSDLHLGTRLERDVLRRTHALEPLLDAVREVDRLVLLGDVVELLEARPARAMEMAEPVLRAIGAGLGAGREVIVVPGNHDIALVRAWLRTHGPPTGVDTRLPTDATPMLGRLAHWLSPAEVCPLPGDLAVRGRVGHARPLPRPAPAAGIRVWDRPRAARTVAADGAMPADYEQGGPSMTGSRRS